jgi:hypothetical protein
MEWHHMMSPKMKKSRTVHLASKVMETIFWYAEECIMVDFLLKEETFKWLTVFGC